MTNLEKVMSEEDVNTNTQTSVETNNTQSSTNTSEEKETAPEASQNANNEEQDISEEQVKEENTDKPVDKSQFTDMEKAQYSFRRQMAKQKEKYEKAMQEREEQFKAMQERLERLENPDKYKEKLRDSFKTDDEYIDYLVGQRMQKYFDMENERNIALQRENEENERHQAEINSNISECFKTEEDQKDYYNVVSEAFSKGLEELMDKEQMCAQYIMKSPNGPKILYELAKDPNKVKQVYGQMDPQSRFFELKMLEREIMSRPAESKPLEKPVVQNPNLAKPVGTPGLAKGNTKDMFDSKEDLRSFIRKR